jgi:hypothetical protein
MKLGPSRNVLRLARASSKISCLSFLVQADAEIASLQFTEGNFNQAIDGMLDVY